MDKRLREVLHKIGEFYLTKHNGDRFDAIEDLESVWITSVKLEGEVVEITSVRISLLIGQMGRNIERLSSYLGRKIKIVENMELSWLIPQEPEKEDSYV